MKTKILLTTLLSCIFYLLQSQVPQGFNYQAIARDGSGTIIANQLLPIEITLQTSLTGNTIIYKELFSSISSDNFGMINLVVGTGTQTGGSAASFSAIDWSVQPLFLKTAIEYPGSNWTTMGTCQIWAVPYSLVAKNIAPLSKLGITGTTSDMEEALFEVKNQAGNTVFAVYNEGIRAYVGNGSAKGKKGGFAVGGYDATKGSTIYDLLTLSTDSSRLYFDSNPTLKGKKGGFAVGGYDMTKGEVQNYLDVSKDSVRVYVDSNPLTKGKKGGFSVGGYDMTKGEAPVQSYLDVSRDSVRIYIDSNPITKGKKGGFAVGGYDMTKGGSSNFLNVATDVNGIINPSENRVMWYPLKNAFVAGRVLAENKDSIGENSFASGYESKAKGQYSQALGFQAIARGDYATSIGKNAIANKANSFSFGDNVQATGQNSYSFGKNSSSSGDGSYSFGFNAIAKGQDSYAFGTGAEARGIGSFAMGFIGRDSAGNATGNTLATYDYSVAMGMGAQATAIGCFAIGVLTKASKDYSTALGYSATASGITSIAIGYRATASALGAFAIGHFTTASGQYSVSMGYQTIASGMYSFTMGKKTIASGNEALAMGSGTIASGVVSTALGGNTTASGTASDASGGYTIAKGYASTARGMYTMAKPYTSLVSGQYNDTTCSIGGDLIWVNTDPAFIIGNGMANNTRSNAFTVLKNGKTAIGHASPTEMLDVNGNARFRAVGSGTYVSSLSITSDGTLTTSTSDISMKKNIIPIDQALKKVLEMNGVYFSWKRDTLDNRRVGFIAQELEKVLPEVVFTNPVDGLKGINYPEITAVLAQAVKEQDQKIEKQQKEIDELKSLVNNLIANQTAQVNK